MAFICCTEALRARSLARSLARLLTSSSSCTLFDFNVESRSVKLDFSTSLHAYWLLCTSNMASTWYSFSSFWPSSSLATRRQVNASTAILCNWFMHLDILWAICNYRKYTECERGVSEGIPISITNQIAVLVRLNVIAQHQLCRVLWPTEYVKRFGKHNLQMWRANIKRASLDSHDLWCWCWRWWRWCWYVPCPLRAIPDRIWGSRRDAIYRHTSPRPSRPASAAGSARVQCL